MLVAAAGWSWLLGRTGGWSFGLLSELPRVTCFVAYVRVCACVVRVCVCVFGMCVRVGCVCEGGGLMI